MQISFKSDTWLLFFNFLFDCHVWLGGHQVLTIEALTAVDGNSRHLIICAFNQLLHHQTDSNIKKLLQGYCKAAVAGGPVGARPEELVQVRDGLHLPVPHTHPNILDYSPPHEHAGQEEGRREAEKLFESLLA